MKQTESVELTVLGRVYHQNQVLLQHRVKDDWMGWTLPGGHVERNESFVDTFVHEMKEETGLTILNPKLCGIKQFPIDGGRYLVLLFKANEFSGTLQSSTEGEVKWFDRSELDKLSLVNDFFELLQVLDNDSFNEFQYIVQDDKWNILIK